MTRKLLIPALVAALAAPATFVLLGAAAPQPAPTPAAAAPKVVICNPVRVFVEMQERRAIEADFKNEADKFENRMAARKNELALMRQNLDALKPDTALYRTNLDRYYEAAIRYDVELRMEQQRRAMIEKRKIAELFDKIRDMCRKIAEERNIDLVLADRQPEITEQHSPQEVRALLGQIAVLHAAKVADITDDVILRLNAEYAQPSGK